jgi:hypothetical protein
MMGFFYVRALDVFRDNSGSVGLNEFITKASSMLLSDGITLVSRPRQTGKRRPFLRRWHVPDFVWTRAGWEP